MSCKGERDYYSLEEKLVGKSLEGKNGNILCSNFGDDYKNVQSELKELIKISSASDYKYILEFAVMADSLEDIKRLVKENASHDTHKYMWGATLLHLAANHASPGVIEYLISIGFDVNDQGKTNGSALHIAVSENRFENIVTLIKNGASINLKNHDGATPIVYTLGCKDHKTFKYLLDKGAVIDDSVRNTAEKIGFELNTAKN